MDITKDNPSLSDISGHEKSESNITPDKQRIPCKDKRSKTSETSIIGKDSIQESYKQIKRVKSVSIPDVEKTIK